jgi:hypothetical protein
MNYTVEWLPSARNDLATLWTAGPDRAAVAAAADAIDAQLERDPHALSESRSGAARVMLFPPLGVAFDVRALDKHVIAWGVWRTA